MRMNRLADIECFCTHFDEKSNLTDHVACVSAKDNAVEDASTASTSLVVRLRFIQPLSTFLLN